MSITLPCHCKPVKFHNYAAALQSVINLVTGTLRTCQSQPCHCIPVNHNHVTVYLLITTMSLYTCQSHNNVTTHLLITGKHHCILFTIALPLQGCSIATVLAVPPHAVLTNCVLRPVNHYCYIKVTVQTSAKLVTCSMGTFSSSSMACFSVLSTPSIRF